ncbi:MAG: UDP-2,3-diacylglucosamine diphosphatase LpxI [Alphaproteobacteria bacterium]|nr:UDP-2,3-diacylglucosamine diphosphatase LpxI [Alphaproteobacteria bacterium]
MAGKLGILAGSGELPGRLIDACKAAERPFFVLAFAGEADPAILADVPHAVIRLGAAGEGFRLLHENKVEELVFAGGIRRPTVTSLRPDWRAAKFFARIGYRALGDNGLLSAVIKELEGEGFRVVGADTILGKSLAPAGTFGRFAPDAQAEADIAHGLAVARALGTLDIGQSVVVQQGLVLGVEAIEGTDALIQRCGGLRRGGPGGVLVKIAKPGQERRVDLPTIGTRTVSAAKKAGLRGIAVEAGSTIVIDLEAVTEAADRAELFITGLALA